MCGSERQLIGVCVCVFKCIQEYARYMCATLDVCFCALICSQRLHPLPLCRLETRPVKQIGVCFCSNGTAYHKTRGQQQKQDKPPVNTGRGSQFTNCQLPLFSVMCFDTCEQRAKKTKQHDDHRTKVLTWTYIQFTQHEFLLFSSNAHSWVPARSILVCVEHKQPDHRPVLTAAAMMWCYLELVASMKNSASLLTRLIVTLISLMHFLKKKSGVSPSVPSLQEFKRIQKKFNQDAWNRRCDRVLLRDDRCESSASMSALH